MTVLYENKSRKSQPANQSSLYEFSHPTCPEELYIIWSLPLQRDLPRPPHSPNLRLHLIYKYIYIYIYMYGDIYIYIYIERERERDAKRHRQKRKRYHRSCGHQKTRTNFIHVERCASTGPAGPARHAAKSRRKLSRAGHFSPPKKRFLTRLPKTL